MPFTDSLFEKGLVFQRATTTVGTTHPAHASMFTGKHPSGHKVRWNGDELPGSELTLAERLQNHGYETAAFVSKPGMLKFGGFAQGFDYAEASEGHLRAASETNDELEQWVANRRGGDDSSPGGGESGRPVFLWLHYFDTHSPYPLTEWSRGELADFSGSLSDGADVHEFFSYGTADLPATPENRRAIEVLYDGTARVLDREIERLMSILEGAGLTSNSILILTADHGQLLGEHELVGHGFRLFEEVIAVPLLYREFGGVSAGESKLVNDRVSLVDLLPSVVERLEMPTVPGDANLPGRSIAALGGEGRQGMALATIRFPSAKNASPVPGSELGMVAAYQDNYKLIRLGESETVYDLDADPLELQPLSPDDVDPEVLLKLRGAARNHQANESQVQSPSELSPELREELEALGYLTSGER